MRGDRMKDNEIIKALECCNSNFAECPKECPMYTTKFNEKTNCIDENNGIMALALDLINRQKAEIEKLQKVANNYKNFYERTVILLVKAYQTADEISENWEKAKSEAYQKFAKMFELKQTLQKLSEVSENA